MIWNFWKPIVIERRFIKPKVYNIVYRELQKELEQIYKKYSNELEKLQ